MSKTEATLTVRIKKVGGAVLKGLKQTMSTLGGAARLAGAAFGVLGTAVAAAAIKAGKFKGVQTSFIKLAQSQGVVADDMLKKMRKLSQGTISDLKLMEQANTAAMLGLPVDRMGDMMKIAMSASQATGQSMEFMTQSMVTGLGRQSKMILDNLGIVFSAEQANKNYALSQNIVGRALTDAEKKQAFINEALRVGTENAEKAGAGQLNLSQMFDKMKASSENATVAIGEAATPALKMFMEQALATFEGLNSATSQSTLQDFFMNTAKVITVVKNLFVLAGEIIGTQIAAVSMGLTALLSGEFSKAKDMIVMGAEEVGAALTRNVENTGKELDEIDQRFMEARIERAAVEVEAKKAIALEAAEEKKEFDLEQFEGDQERLAGQKQREIDLIGATESMKTDIALKAIEKRLKNEKVVKKKKDLWQQKQDLLEKKRKEVLQKFEEDKEAEKFATIQDTLSRISTLQSSNNKTLVAVGKAAAIAQIAISTSVGAMRAFEQLGPFGAPAAALIIAAGAVQAANVAGVKLADGGIVPDTPGGINAIIGEGGRSEAVVPLPDDFDPDDGGGIGGGGNTFVFNGPVLGDESQAREFAIQIDEQLLELRRSNESLAFDEGII